MNLNRHIIPAFCLLLISSCMDTTEQTDQDVAIEEIIETIDDEEKVEEREAAIEEDMQLLDEQQRKAMETAVKEAQEKRAEKLEGSSLKPFVGDPEGLIEHLRQNVKDARIGCKADELEAFMKATSDDLIFRSVYDDDDYYEEIDAIFLEGRELIDSCRNP